MEYFSKFLRASAPQQPKSEYDRVQGFHKAWQLIRNTLQFPDERQLTKGIISTDVPANLQLLVDSLVWESTRADEGTTGQCLEYLLKNDILGNLVRLSETDRPFGIQALTLRSVANLVVLLDEQFLVHSVVHKAVLRLLQNCVGDQIEERVDGRARLMGAASNPKRTSPSEYEEDLVDLLCILCSRIRNHKELLMIFFHDKHWYQNHLLAVTEEDEDEDRDDQTSNPEFFSNRSTSPAPSRTTTDSDPGFSTRRKVEYEFLLFNYLLRFLHREGRIGDFARAGLLFLMDVAMSASDNPGQNASDPMADAALALAEYVLDGDFSDVLSAGLGAVYSVLHSKIVVRPGFSQSINGMVLEMSTLDSDNEPKKTEYGRDQNLGLQDTSSFDFKTRLDHFLKLLNFLKDVLRRNETANTDLAPTSLVGSAIVQSILNAVRSVFLENILYTSILECSDMDGSAVAVMTYIDIMIRVWAGSQLGDMLVEFLMNEDEYDSRGSQLRSLDYTRRERSRIKKLRRKSSAMAFLEMDAPDARKPSEYITSVGRFTLKDLVFSNLRSSSPRSVISASYLLQSLLIYHPIVCIDKLLVSLRDPNATSFPQPARSLDLENPFSYIDDADEDAFVYPGEEVISRMKISNVFKQPDMTFPIHNLEMTMYHGLLSRIGSADIQAETSFSTGYTHYLYDALMLLQSHRAFRENFWHERAPGFSLHHHLDPNDPLLVLVLKSLQDFFRHSPEYNIALTGVLAALALDPYRSLSGWLVFSAPNKATDDSVLSFDALDGSDDESVDNDYTGHLLSSQADGYDLRALPLNETLRPVVYSLYSSLISQLDRCRFQISHFDKYLFERRQGLLVSENLNDALNLALGPPEEKPHIPPSSPRPPPRPKTKTVGNSLVAFLSPKKKTTSRSPSQSTDLRTQTQDNKVISSRPFGSHYQQTKSVSVSLHSAQLPATGPWSSANKPAWSVVPQDSVTSGRQWADDDELDQTVHAVENGGTVEEQQITLSRLLDNIVILEESIKELTAIIYARRSLGIDSVRYV